MWGHPPPGMSYEEHERWERRLVIANLIGAALCFVIPFGAFWWFA